jgi:hypothetical protein
VAIMQGPPLLAGTGKVTWVRDFNPAEPQRAHGMGVQFLQLAPNSRTMLGKLLEHKSLPPRFTPALGVPISSALAEGRRPTARSLPVAGEGDLSAWMDDQGVKWATDRARFLASKVEDVEALRIRERDEPPSLAEALAQLPRLLDARRQ